MHWFFRRDSWLALESWLTSAAVHLVILLGGALLLLPRLGNVQQVIVQGAIEPLEAEPTWIELAAPEFQPEPVAEPELPNVVDLGELTINSPSAVALRGASGAEGDDGASRGDGEGGETGSASFFGTEAYGNAFVYVLDVSPSMNARGGKRLERAVLELLRSIDTLYEDQRFYVIVFGYEARLMFDDSGLFPRTIPATLQNKQLLRAWLAHVSTIAGTDPRDALHVGLKMQPSAVFLLSDGEFNGRRRTSMFGLTERKVEDIVAQASLPPPTPIPPGATTSDSAQANADQHLPQDQSGEWASNKGRQVPVHTIAFEDQSSEPAMKRVAEVSGGIHRFVPAPAGTANVTAQPSSRRSLRGIVTDFRFRGEGR
jgi:hypothetical protein